MAEVRQYRATLVKYKQGSGSWYANNITGNKVASNDTSGGVSYSTRITLPFADIRNMNLTHYITGISFNYCRTAEFSNHVTNLRIMNASEAAILEDVSLTDSQGWNAVALSAGMIASILDGGTAYIGTFNGTNGTYIEFYDHNSEFVPFLLVTWEPRDTSSKATIYANAGSDAMDAPVIYHTLEYSASRNGGVITLIVKFNAIINTMLSPGKSLLAAVSCPGYNIAVSGYNVLKETNEYWSAVHSNNRTVVFTVTVYDVNAAAAINLTTTTYRSDGGLQGAHTRTTTIGVPAAATPVCYAAVYDGVAAPASLVAPGATVRQVITGANGGNAAVTGYGYQYTLNPYSGAPTWNTYTSGGAGEAYFALPGIGAGFSTPIGLRAYLVNAWGQVAYSGMIIITTCTKPVTPFDITTDVAIVAGVGSAFGLHWKCSNGPDHTIAGYEIMNYGAHNSGALDIGLYVPQANSERGQTVYYPIRSRVVVAGINAYSDYSPWTAAIKTAVLPTNPGQVAPNPAAIAPTEALGISFPKSTPDPLISIASYLLEIARHDGSAWSAWQNANVALTAGASNVTGTDNPIVDFPALRAGNKLKYRVKATDTLGNTSGYSTDSAEIPIKSARLWEKQSGAWASYVLYNKIGGTWKEAIGLYHKVGGAWREAI